jgi:hypothetical protein
MGVLSTIRSDLACLLAGPPADAAALLIGMRGHDRGESGPRIDKQRRPRAVRRVFRLAHCALGL